MNSAAKIDQQSGSELPDWIGVLAFTASGLNQHFAGAVKTGEERYELRRLPLRGRRAKAD